MSRCEIKPNGHDCNATLESSGKKVGQVSQIQVASNQFLYEGMTITIGGEDLIVASVSKDGSTIRYARRNSLKGLWIRLKCRTHNFLLGMCWSSFIWGMVLVAVLGVVLGLTLNF